MDVKELFENTPGFGDVCFETYGRYPSIATLERKDVRPGNVKNLPVDSGVNPITHDFRVNYTEWRTHMISINNKFSTILPVDGIQFLLSTTCEGVKNGNIKISYFETLFFNIYCFEEVFTNVKLINVKNVG